MGRGHSVHYPALRRPVEGEGATPPCEGIVTRRFCRLFKGLTLLPYPPTHVKTFILTLAAVGAAGFVAGDPPAEILDFAGDPPAEILDFV